MPKLTIDGIEVEVEDGLNIIQAAAKIGVEVPHFCYHPELSIVAQCRQCLVEVEGVPKVLPACNTFVRDDLVVKTNTEKAIKARTATLEFTLINHPLDCPICDKGGECPLQLTTFKHGPGYSRFDGPDQKKVRQKYYLSDNIVYDPNRCIMCTRCVRFTSEVTKTGELGYDNRGFRKRIVIFPGKKLDNDLAGNVIDLCPVGALLDKDTLHEERVWYWEFTDTVCSLCSNGCNITVGVDPRKGRISRIRPRFNNEVNGFWICDRGRYGFKDIQDKKRIKDPIIRVKKGFDTTDWESSYKLITKNIKAPEQDGTSKMAILASPKLTNEELFLVQNIKDAANADILISNIGKQSEEKKFGLISTDPYPNTSGITDFNIENSKESFAGLIDSLISKEINKLIVINNDLFEIIEDSDRSKIVEALSGLEFLLVIDTRLTETMKYAHLILPCASFYEREGTYTNDLGRVQKINKCIDPPGNAKPQWEILLNIIDNLGEAESEYENPNNIFEKLSAKITSFHNMNYDKLGFMGMMKLS